MCDCKCCCAASAPPWWVTMGFVPPTNPSGQTHTGVVVPAPPAATHPATPTGGTSVTTTGGRPTQPTGGLGGIIGGVGNAVGGVVNTLLNPLGALGSLL